MKVTTTLTSIAALAVLAGTSSFAQNGPRNVQFSSDGRAERLMAPKAGMNSADRRLFKDVSFANIFEIKSSEIAQRNGSSAFVQEFSKEMITDHTAAQEELKQLADKKGVNVPQDLPSNLSRTLRKLNSLHGAAFDNAYRSAQLGGHQATEAKLKNYLRAGRDEDVRAYAVKTLPAVVMHKKMVVLQKTMMGETKMDHGE